MRILVILFSGLLTLACAVGPEFKKPTIQAPETFVNTTEIQTKQEPKNAWWRHFEDPILDDLISRSETGNYDLKIAAARLRQAQAATLAAKRAGMPSVDGEAGYSRNRISLNSPSGDAFAVRSGAAPRYVDRFSLGARFSWELDAFGAIQRTIEGAEARGLAAQATLADAHRLIRAAVAQEYLALRGLQSQLAVIGRNTTVQEQTLDLVRNKYKAGLVGNHDVQRAMAQAAATRAEIAPLQAQIQAGAARIATLIGETPEATTFLLESNTEPIFPGPVDLGLPHQLIARRPDIASAEATWRAATADVGARTADLYPRINLAGALNLISAQGGDLLGNDSLAGTAGPLIYMPLFNRKRIHAAVAAAEAAEDATEAEWHRTVLRAFEEVESALAVYNGNAASLLQRHRARAAAAGAVNTAEVLYDKGLRDFLTVLDAQRELLRMEAAEAQTQTARNLALIDLFRALGG